MHRDSTKKAEVQASVINMPLTGKTLFGSEVDEALGQLKKDNEVAMAMGALQFR